MRKFEDAVLTIKENLDDCIITGEISDKRIESAEKYLDLKFPKSYRQFLKEFGTAMIGSEQIYGIIPEGDFTNSGIPDAIWFTQCERNDSNLPKELVIIYFTGDEFYFCLDTSQMKNDECPVVAISFDGEKEIVYDNFTEFLFEECISLLFE